MMSKSSFLVNMKENNKRRLWVWAISLLIFLIALPAYTALTINATTSGAERLIEIYGEELAREILQKRLISGMCNALGFSRFLLIAVAVIAVISAVQGFSWLYSRKKIDFYLGMPVKRKKRFLVIWLNGILLYLIPYLLGLFVSMLIAAGNGGLNGTVAKTAATAFGVYFCFYLCVYHMALLAVMLTGNVVITGFGFLVFCLYEFVVRWTLYNYKEMFFQYFCTYETDISPVLSPFTMVVSIISSFEERQVIEYGNVAGLIFFGLALLALSYLCYLKRPGEAAGRAMVFGITRPVIKILLAVPAALLVGVLIAETVGFYPEDSMEGIGYVIFAMVLMVILGSAVIQVIYEFDIKGAFHKKYQILIAGGITALIFLVFCFDLTGYDSYVPGAESVESAAFIPDYYEDTMRGSPHFDGDGRYMWDYEYADRFMQLKDVEDVCELAQISIDGYGDWYERFKSGADPEDGEGERYYWSRGTIIYHLKNGRSVSRTVCVNINDERTGLLLDRIMGSEEFKKGYMPGASENLDVMLSAKDTDRRISATYGNNIYSQRIGSEEVLDFLKIYRKDLAKANFSNIRANAPIGVFYLNMEENAGLSFRGKEMTGTTRGWTVGVNLYPFYEESIRWLKDHGYYMEGQLAIEDVDHIQIVNQNSEIREKLEEQKESLGDEALINVDALAGAWAGETAFADSGDMDGIDTRVYADYKEQEDIRQIADCIYPVNLLRDDWDNGVKKDRNYDILVYFKSGSDVNRNYGTYAEYCFLEDQVPEFVAEDTAYEE